MKLSENLKTQNILSIDFDWIESLKDMEELIIYISKNINKNIIFSYYHDNIYSLFKHGVDEYNLINVDKHHDYIYNQNVLLDEGNWIFHLSNVFYKKINYIWISKNNSEHNKDNRLRKNLKNFNFYHSLDNIPNLKFDNYFFCCSPEYSNQFSNTAYEIIRKIYEAK